MDPYRQPPGPAGYPPAGYPAAPPQGYPPPNAYQQQPPHYAASSEAAFINCICLMILLTILVGSVVCIIVFTILLNASQPTVALDSLTVSDLSTTSSTISASIDVTITIRNRDAHLHAYYDDVDVMVTFRDQVIGWGRVLSFDQAKKTQDSKPVRVIVASSPLDKGRLNDLKVDQMKGGVKFGVESRWDAWFKLNRLFSGRGMPLESRCDDVPIGMGSNSSHGNLAGGSRSCNVRIRTSRYEHQSW